MKIEIDLRGLVTEDGSLVDEIVDEIKLSVIATFSASIKDAVTAIVSEELKATASAALAQHLADVLPSILDQPYIEKDSWGSVKKTWTLRAKIADHLGNLLKYDKSRYPDDHFSKYINQVLDMKLESFKKEAFREIDSKFVADCMAAAEKRMKERMGVK